MSSRGEVFVRTLVLQQRKTLIETKNWHIKKMLKTALFDCAINEKCCSVDGGGGICPLFWQLKSPHPRLGAAAIDWCIRGWCCLSQIYRETALLLKTVKRCVCPPNSMFQCSQEPISNDDVAGNSSSELSSRWRAMKERYPITLCNELYEDFRS